MLKNIPIMHQIVLTEQNQPTIASEFDRLWSGIPEILHYGNVVNMPYFKNERVTIRSFEKLIESIAQSNDSHKITLSIQLNAQTKLMLNTEYLMYLQPANCPIIYIRKANSKQYNLVIKDISMYFFLGMIFLVRV